MTTYAHRAISRNTKDSKHYMRTFILNLNFTLQLSHKRNTFLLEYIAEFAFSRDFLQFSYFWFAFYESNNK